MNTLVLLLTVKDGNTPLMAAVQENRLEAARLLVMECNCNTNVRNKVRCSILVMSALLCAVQLCVYLCLIISWGEAIMCCLVFQSAKCNNKHLTHWCLLGCVNGHGLKCF